MSLMPKVFGGDPTVMVPSRPGQQGELKVDGGRRTEQDLGRPWLTQRTGGGGRRAGQQTAGAVVAGVQ